MVHQFICFFFNILDDIRRSNVPKSPKLGSSGSIFFFHKFLKLAEQNMKKTWWLRKEFLKKKMW